MTSLRHGHNSRHNSKINLYYCGNTNIIIIIIIINNLEIKSDICHK